MKNYEEIQGLALVPSYPYPEKFGIFLKKILTAGISNSIAYSTFKNMATFSGFIFFHTEVANVRNHSRLPCLIRKTK